METSLHKSQREQQVFQVTLMTDKKLPQALPPACRGRCLGI